MTREQADHLPEFGDLEKIDYDYEEQVRGVYRPTTTRSTMVDTSLESSAPLEASAPLDTSMAGMGMSAMAAQPAVTPTYNRDTYDYKQDASLYDLDEQNHQTLKLYQERLVANKQRVKSGEVAIGKHVETETARVAVPVEKERVIIERVTPTDAGRAVTPGEAAFREGEVAHVEIYEEQASVQKEAFVREEVRVSKEVEQKTVETQETIRREELDVNTTDTPIVDTSKRLPNDRI